MMFLQRKLTLTLVTAALLVSGVVATGFVFPTLFIFPPSGGSLSSYLVGYFDTTTDDTYGNTTLSTGVDADAFLYLVNPTNKDLTAFVAIFDENQDVIDCTDVDLSPNDLEVIKLVADGFVGFERGVIKIVTVDQAFPDRVQAGIKGWIVHHLVQDVSNDNVLSRESHLQEVPVGVLRNNRNAELNAIAEACAD